MTEQTMPQPLVYLIHDDQDRAVAEILARHFAAADMPAWYRGMRPPKGQGADQVLKKAKAAVLLTSDVATHSQIVNVDLIRAAREHVPVARLLLQASAADFAADHAPSLSSVEAYGDLDEPVITALFDSVRPAATRRGFSFARALPHQNATSHAAALKTKTAGPDASAIGLRMTLQRLLPVLLIGAAFVGGGTWWWIDQSRQNEIVEIRRRAADRTPLPTGMQDLTAGKFIEAASAMQTNAQQLPAGVIRAGYDAEPSATDEQVAEAATLLEVVRISRSGFRMENGKRVCDVQVTIANKSATAQPVVALTIGIRDKANLNLAERLLKVERRWVPSGATRVIEGQLSDLPKWAQTISVKVSATKA